MLTVFNVEYKCGIKQIYCLHVRGIFVILLSKAYILLNFLRISPYSLGIIPVLLQWKSVLLFQKLKLHGISRKGRKSGLTGYL